MGAFRLEHRNKYFNRTMFIQFKNFKMRCHKIREHLMLSVYSQQLQFVGKGRNPNYIKKYLRLLIKHVPKCVL